MAEQTLVARWESSRGAHVVELHKANGSAYQYVDGDNHRGYLEAEDRDAAISEIQTKVDTGFFLPDNAKRPMRRVV